MKVLILFWLCFPLAISGKGGKGFKVKEVADLAFEVISLSIDFIDQLTSGDDSNTIQKSIKNLQSSVDKLHEKLDYTTQLVESLISLINEQPYKISISQHIEQIKSCKTDLENVLETPNSIAARENFRKCYVIMNNVRAIGGYLSGQAIIGLHPFFESYRHKDGYYNGYAIKTMFQYLYTHFVDGCTVVVTAERIQFNQTSTIYKDECWKTVSEIYTLHEGILPQMYQSVLSLVYFASGKISRQTRSSRRLLCKQCLTEQFSMVSVPDIGIFKL